MTRLPILKRSSQRVSITVSQAVFDTLQRCADEQGRSLSNLAAYILERGTEQLRLGASRSE